MKKKIIITAPTSVVARNYIKYLDNKYDLVTVGRKNSDIIFDFAKDEQLHIPDGADAVIHFAGVMHANSPEEICEMVNTNIAGLVKVCAAAKRSKAKQIIYISSINATLFENSLYYGYYSLTKKQGEELAALYCKKEGLKLCIIRPSQIFGPNPDYGKTQPLLYLMIKNALENRAITVYGNKDVLRNYIYADNLFRIIDEAVERQSEDIINAISSENISLSNVAKLIIDVMGSSSEIVFLKDKPDMEDNAFYTEVNYFEKWNVPFVPFEDAMEQVVKGFTQGGIKKR